MQLNLAMRHYHIPSRGHSKEFHLQFINSELDECWGTAIRRTIISEK